MPRRRGSTTGIPGLSFSMCRALGISQAQAKLSWQIDIPLSRRGRWRKIGRSRGCCWILLIPVGVVELVRLLG